MRGVAKANVFKALNLCSVRKVAPELFVAQIAPPHATKNRLGETNEIGTTA